jgi:hypothetical protein
MRPRRIRFRSPPSWAQTNQCILRAETSVSHSSQVSFSFVFQSCRLGAGDGSSPNALVGTGVGSMPRNVWLRIAGALQRERTRSAAQPPRGPLSEQLVNDRHRWMPGNVRQWRYCLPCDSRRPTPIACRHQGPAQALLVTDSLVMSSGEERFSWGEVPKSARHRPGAPAPINFPSAIPLVAILSRGVCGRLTETPSRRGRFGSLLSRLAGAGRHRSPVSIAALP